MWALSLHAESDFRLESFYLKCIALILMGISFVVGNECIVCIQDYSLTSRVTEVEFFHVVDKDVILDFFDAFNISTFVYTHGWEEIFSSCMSDDFLSTISASIASVVVALDEELEVTPSFDHFVIGLLVIIKLLQICDITSNLTASDSANSINYIPETDGCTSIGQILGLDLHDKDATCDSCNQKYRGYNYGHMHGGILLKWNIRLGNIWIAGVKITQSKSGKPLVYGRIYLLLGLLSIWVHLRLRVGLRIRLEWHWVQISEGLVLFEELFGGLGIFLAISVGQLVLVHLIGSILRLQNQAMKSNKFITLILKT